MTEEALDIAFNNAVERINQHKEPFPADFLLRLYAYYKRATLNRETPSSRIPLINAFKANALFQSQNISPSEAKEAYIQLVNDYFDKQ
ncbi:acyl-CoA-binding protein [Sungkyunkwania multivorans]|uniref:Acyl-CoA-binding protein n=1 Tax=Sungkyunkwania multivorans TaxID=1173618 RepID=A0ABW3CXU4_9FLAO